ncbi:glycosyltransferase family 2 protein [Candidatus Palauibacter sp.]|uniref:glycosyltransferase family 2 protein n=1 Tax=Candidatus Palauibacter sp. TaxID=3101350 RepID=UPI003B02794D
MIHIGIPVHNERETIGPLLWRIRELLYGERRQFHVLVCDDASDDGTDEALERYPRVLPLTVLRNEERRGYAASLDRLIRATLRRSDYPRRDAFVSMQGDFSDPPERLPEMLRRFEGGADLVTVARGDTEPFTRRLTRAGGRLCARHLLSSPAVTDPYASLRLYRLFALERAVAAGDGPLLPYEGWAANAALLLQVWPFVRRFEEIPHDSHPLRRYRDARFRAGEQLRQLFAAGRDRALREIGRQIAEAA